MNTRVSSKLLLTIHESFTKTGCVYSSREEVLKNMRTNSSDALYQRELWNLDEKIGYNRLARTKLVHGQQKFASGCSDGKAPLHIREVRSSENRWSEEFQLYLLEKETRISLPQIPVQFCLSNQRITGILH